MSIVIVDYEVGNIFNLKNAFSKIGSTAVTSRDPDVIRKASKLILPGVGAFAAGMTALNGFSLIESIQEFAKSGRPMLGICLGMQLLYEQSEEDGVHSGLGLIPGSVTKFQTNEKLEYKVPHMTWNSVEVPQAIKAPKNYRSQIQQDPYFYFVHSYYAPVDERWTLLKCNYANVQFSAGVKKDNIFGYQFHPERSGPAGLNLLKDFIKAT